MSPAHTSTAGVRGDGTPRSHPDRLIPATSRGDMIDGRSPARRVQWGRCTGGRMARSEFIGRGQQVGIVVAAGVVPTTFTRSLSERTWKDQGLITGLATGTHFLLTVMAQDLIDSAGTAMSTVLPFPASWDLDRRQRAATLLLDVAAVPVGFGVVALIGTRDHEPTVRAVARQAGWRFGLTGVGATILAASVALQRGLDSRLGADGRIERFPIGIPVGLATAAVIERIRQRDTPPEHVADPARSNPALGLAAGAGVVLAISGLTIGESWLARQLGSVGSRVLPGSETTWRRAGHLLSLGRRGRWHARGLGAGHARHRGRHVEVRRGHGRVRARSVHRSDRQRRPGEPRRLGHDGSRGTSARRLDRAARAAGRPPGRGHGQAAPRPVDLHGHAGARAGDAHRDLRRARQRADGVRARRPRTRRDGPHRCVVPLARSR